MTIEQLLETPSNFLESLDDPSLKEYLKDITNLEPKPFGRVIIEDDCPIKKSKKRSSNSFSTKKATADSIFAEMEKDMKGIL